VLLVALAACGGESANNSSTTSPSPSPASAAKTKTGPHIASIDACSVVSSDLISKDLHATLQGAGSAATCTYASADGTMNLLVFGEVLPDTQAADAVQPSEIASQFNISIASTTAKPLNNVGDKAIEYTVAAGGQSEAAILIFKANAVMMLVITPSPSDLSGFEALAKDSADALR
jgi:hypothetical protein